MSRGTFASLIVLVLLAACGAETAPAPHTLPDKGARVPITARAVAAIMLAHLPHDTTARAAMYIDKADEPGTVGADLRYGGGAGTDGDLVRAALIPGSRGVACKQRCVELDTDLDGAVLTLHWDEAAPESDPGVVTVVVQWADEYAYVYQSGPTITKDPRELNLDISVEEMVALAEDAWLRTETSPEAVAAGEAVEDWESDDLEYGIDDPVPNTHLGLLAAYLDFENSSVPYVDHRSSPLTAALGAGAIGGRMTIPPENGYILGDEQMEVDILASPDRTAWIDGDPCASATFRDHCHRYRGEDGPVFLAWIPAANGDTGLVWVGNVRDDEVVAIRIRGFQVPEARVELENQLGLFTFRDQLDNNERLGMTTDREVLDAASGL